MKNNGHVFEQEFKNSVPIYMYSKKLKVSGMNYKGGGNECDYLVYSKPNLFLFELKSHKGKSLPFEKIRENQLIGLSNYSRLDGVVSGVIINFRDYEKTLYIPIRDLIVFMSTTERKSIPIEWCEEHGVLVEQKKLRTRYKYDIEKLISEIKEGNNG